MQLLKTISIIFLPVYFHIVDIIGKTQYNEHIIKYEFVELSRQRAENPLNMEIKIIALIKIVHSELVVFEYRSFKITLESKTEDKEKDLNRTCKKQYTYVRK